MVCTHSNPSAGFYAGQADDLIVNEHNTGMLKHWEVGRMMDINDEFLNHATHPSMHKYVMRSGHHHCRQTTRTGPASATPAPTNRHPSSTPWSSSFTTTCSLGSTATAHGWSRTHASASPARSCSSALPTFDYNHSTFHQPRELQSPVCVLAWRHPASVIQSLSNFDIKAERVGMNSQRWAQLALDMWMSALQACRGVPTVLLPSDLTAPATVEAFLQFAFQQIKAARDVHRLARTGQLSEPVEVHAEVRDSVPAVGLMRRLQEARQSAGRKPLFIHKTRQKLPVMAKQPVTVPKPPPPTDELRTAAVWEPRMPPFAVLWRHFLRYHAQSSHAAGMATHARATVQACSVRSTLIPVGGEELRWNVTVPLGQLVDGLGIPGFQPVHDAVASLWPEGCAVDPPLDLKLLVVATEAVLQAVAERPGELGPTQVASEVLALHAMLRREWDTEALARMN